MRIVKNLKDESFNEDERFFADLIKDEFNCNTCLEEIKNPKFIQAYAQPLNDFNIYNTAQPTVEGVRLIGWTRHRMAEQAQF